MPLVQHMPVLLQGLFALCIKECLEDVSYLKLMGFEK